MNIPYAKTGIGPSNINNSEAGKPHGGSPNTKWSCNDPTRAYEKTIQPSCVSVTSSYCICRSEVQSSFILPRPFSQFPMLPAHASIMSNSSVVYFYLEPENQAARAIVSNPPNEWLRECRPDGSAVLRVGFNHEPKTRGHLLSFGSNLRLNDVILPPIYPRQQCHFWIHSNTGELLLQDDTENKSTTLSVAGGSKYHLPNNGPRQRVLTIHLNVLIKMQAAHFRLWWGPMTGQPEAVKTAMIDFRFRQSLGQASAPPYPLATSTSARRGPLIHHRLQELGRGASAVVYQTIDLTTGDHLAVKTWQPAVAVDKECFIEIVKKEMQIASQLSHVRNRP